jgi:hypothetical protein
MKNLAPMLLALAACATGGSGAMVDQQNATGHIQPSERERVLASAVRVLQSRGWVLETQDLAAGTLNTQTMQTGMMECASILCNSRGTLHVTVSPAGEVSVLLEREFYVPPPGPGWFRPRLDDDVIVIEREQKKILGEILAPDPGK